MPSSPHDEATRSEAAPGDHTPVSTAPSPRPPRLTPHAFLDRFDDAAATLARLIDTGDLDARIPTCPDWTFSDLVAHLGTIHQWSEHAVRSGDPDAHPITAPFEREPLAQWYRECARSLSRTLRDADPHSPAWTFGPPPGTASFWYRRQAHETIVHLYDAESAHGEPGPIECMTALDGIDEVTGMFFPRQVTTGRIHPLRHSLALETQGPGGPNRRVLAHGGTGPAAADDAGADATVAGTPQALLLLLWRRIGIDDDRLDVTGDRSAARAVLTTALTP